MIFSSLFRPKHQSPNPQVRLNAITSLNAHQAEQKTVLHELAFNDPDVNVSLAALDKLDSFVLWYKMAEISKNGRVLKKSQQVVEKILLDEDSNKITRQEKHTFIRECNDNRLLEKLVVQPWLQNESELMIQTLDKLAKPQLAKQLMFSSSNPSLQLTLLKYFETEADLNKVLKKVNAQEVKQAAEQHLAKLLSTKHIPAEVDKQTRLVLARLLALKDSQSLPELEKQRELLADEYQKLSSNFSYLIDSKTQEFNEKFADISCKLDKSAEKLRPLWLAHKSSLALQESVDKTSAELETLLASIRGELDVNADTIDEQLAEKYLNELKVKGGELEVLIARLEGPAENSRRQLESLHTQLLSCQTTLQGLPAFQLALVQANQLLESFCALALPNDISQVDAATQHQHEMKNQWRSLTNDFQGNLPKSLSANWQAQLGNWQKAIAVLRKQLRDDIERCRSKIRAVDSLVTQGKFKSAMGLYEKVSRWYSVLPENQQVQLSRQFIKIKEQIENLKDWQEYIAAPRKPALLTEAEGLLNKPLDIKQQASKIKELRQQWNSLGKIENEADQILNKAFEETIEKAFEPCREFYTKQDQQREANNNEKQALIGKLAELAGQEIPSAELARQLRNVQQQWQGIGEVDFKLRESLNKTYKNALAPLKAKVSQFYADNAELKSGLLDKAKKLIELEPIGEAIEQAKGLQNKWKTIEHAGKKAEAELWSAFRSANDQVFARLKTQQQQEKQELDAQIGQVNSLLTAMQEKVSAATDKNSLTASIESQSDISALLSELPSRIRSTLEKALNENIQTQQKKLLGLKQNQKRQQYESLFLALKEWSAEDELPELVPSLPSAWQQCFRNTSSKPTWDRHALTIVMEIIEEQDSPKGDTAKRKDIQLQLMAEKLQHGVNKNLDELLKDWIQQGPLTAQDKKCLKRVALMFKD
jgi:hypothetical protein